MGNKLKTHLHVVRSGETTLDGRGKDACKHSKIFFLWTCEGLWMYIYKISLDCVI